MFFESSPFLLGQHGSCSTAQQQKTFYKTFPPDTVHIEQIIISSDNIQDETSTDDESDDVDDEMDEYSDEDVDGGGRNGGSREYTEIKEQMYQVGL